MKIRNIFQFLLIISVLAFCGCALKPVKTIEITGDASYKNTLLIATQESEFKDAVVNDIIEALKADRCYIKIVDVINLPAETDQNYDAVVIINRCIAWEPTPEVNLFVEKAIDKRKILLLTTAKGKRCRVDPLGVDAVTSASAVNDTGEVAQLIIGKIRALFHSQK